jgi:NAD(P)-dependent dehydrogenase (short-subunit alcohol dehydrogenase family)
MRIAAVLHGAVAIVASARCFVAAQRSGRIGVAVAKRRDRATACIRQETSGRTSVMANSPLALVTGGARGIGAEVCRLLAADGFTVIVTARDGPRAEALASALVADGHDAEAARLDVGDRSSVARLADGLDRRTLDVLVNNAAAFADWGETPSTADIESSVAVLDTNLLGPWRVTQALLPALRRSRSARIVNVTSSAGSHGEDSFGLGVSPSAASYAVSKAALNALTVKLAVELRDEGILVNAVDPGLTATAPGMEDMGARPISEGAASVVWAARLEADGPTGGFFRDGRPLPW